MRRFVAAMFVAIVGTVAAGGSAAAAPSPYVDGAVSVEYLGDNQYAVNHTNFGTPDAADDTIELVVSYGGPSGLRSSAGLAAAAAETEVYVLDPDDDGNVTAVVEVAQGGDIYFASTGTPSGDSDSVAVTHVYNGPRYSGTTGGSGGSGGSGGAGGSGGTGGSGGSSWSGGGKTGVVYQQGSGSSSGGYDTGLANTGASLAGPMAIGVAALLAGLALLFFGTRGIARRKELTNSQQ